MPTRQKFLAAVAGFFALWPFRGLAFGELTVADLDIYRDEYLPNDQQATIRFSQWVDRYASEHSAWTVYRDAVLAGQNPVPPDTSSWSRFGKKEIAAAMLAASETTTEPPPPLALPSIPTGLTVATVNGNQAQLTWNSNPPGDQVDVYQVYMDDANLDLAVAGTTFTTAALTGSHTFRVSAHNATGYGEWSSAVNFSVSAPPAGDDYTYRFATFNPATDKITGCLNRFQPSYSWWVPGSPEGTLWPDGGGIHPISHPTYGPGLNLVVTDDMLYGNATAGPKDSNVVRFASETGMVDSRLKNPAPGSRHTWRCTIMRPSGFTWRNDQYECVWEVPMTAAGSNNVGHHIFLQKDYHWPGFSYYFGHQWGSGPLGGVYWTRYNCPISFNADEYHTLRWEILWSGIGQANGAIKCWTSVNGGPEQQWLNLTNVVTLPPQFSQIYQMYVTIRPDLGNPTHSLHVHNMQVKIA